MRTGLQCLALALVFSATGCGIPKDRYDAQVARAKQLEGHLHKKIDRLDYVEGLLKQKTGKTDNARDNVALVLTLAGRPAAEAQARATELLDYLEVGHKKGKVVVAAVPYDDLCAFLDLP